jgi:hypothetical protein
MYIKTIEQFTPKYETNCSIRKSMSYEKDRKKNLIIDIAFNSMR